MSQVAIPESSTPTVESDSRRLAEEIQFQKLKVNIHEHLVESLELSMLAQARQTELVEEVRAVAEEICKERLVGPDKKYRERVLSEIADEVFGLGPIQHLMEDESVSDILVNHPHEVYLERHGRLEETEVAFADTTHLMRIIQRIVARVGRRIDETSPMVDARLPDGSRVNAVVPPLALDGPTLSIRRFGTQPLSIDDLVANGTLPGEMVDFLAAAVDARISVLISGGTGAGKTTFLNSLARYIPRGERLVSIEDSAELILQHKHVVRLETRPANTELMGEITQRDLVRNSLRMRPDRIIVGEVRGPEALDMLQAMNTGHDGSLTTIHANDTRDALSRLEMMVAMTGYELPVAVVRDYVNRGIGLLVHVARLKGGLRRVMRISEIVCIEDEDYIVENICGFEQSGIDADGIALGEFYFTGRVPGCVEEIRSSGVQFPDSLFEQRRIPVKSSS